MKKIFMTIIIFIVIIGIEYFSVNIGKQVQLQNMRETYLICLIAHSQIDGTSERACGDAQDRTSTEFVCNKTSPYCWLEVK